MRHFSLIAGVMILGILRNGGHLIASDPPVQTPQHLQGDVQYLPPGSEFKVNSNRHSSQECDAVLGDLLFADVVSVHFIGPGHPANPDGSLGGLDAGEDGTQMKIYQRFIVVDAADSDGTIYRTLHTYEKLGKIVQRLACPRIDANQCDPLPPGSLAIGKLPPKLLRILRNARYTDPNAIPMSSAGVKICGNQASGTPEVNEDAVPAGYTLLPLEFMLDRGDVAALNAGDQVSCTFHDDKGNDNRWIADATILAASRPFAKDGNQFSTKPGPTNPATHRVFTLLVTHEAHKRFWDTYDLDRAASGRQIGVLTRHPDSSRH